MLLQKLILMKMFQKLKKKDYWNANYKAIIILKLTIWILYRLFSI